jgi:hypothetical protein
MYLQMTNNELQVRASRGDTGAQQEIERRLSKKRKASTEQARSMANPQAQKPSRKRPAVRKKADRSAGWSDKKRLFVERARKAMSRARDIMEELGWFPAEAIRQAWVEEKSGLLDDYTPRERKSAPPEVQQRVAAMGRRKNNPYFN